MNTAMWRNSVIVAVIGLAASMLSAAPPANGPAGVPRIPLWTGGAPGAVKGPDKDADPDQPTLDVYLPAKDKAVGTAVVICPGGGYGHLAVDKEGKQVAQMFNTHGVAGFVLRYRHAPRYHYPFPQNDAKRAVRFVRTHAAEYGIDPHRIGLMGFSAGGHLASSIVTHFDDGDPAAADPIDRASCRPDFGVLCYPVITFTNEPYVHKGSRRNLVGEDHKLWQEMSSELHVTAQTPPCWLYSTNADTGVPCENVILFFEAMRKAHVPGELHIFQPGHHGLGMAQSIPDLAVWPGMLINWMGLNGWMKPIGR